MSWQFQYWNGSSWVNFANAQVDHILEELSSVGGQEELSFVLPNTSANRTIVQGNPFVQALFNGAVIFPLANQNAIATSRQSTPTQITVTAYNYIYVLLSQASQTVTKSYITASVSSIATFICGLAGVTVGSMPSLNVSIKFNNANCFKAMQDLAKACGSDYWADTAFNIGTRDSTTQTLGYVGNNTKRGIDYSKQVDQVIVKGVDASGVQIQGSAGSPGALATFTEKKVSDIATLNNIAAFKLQKLNNPSNGNSLECLISQVATWHPGQYVSANRPDLELVGSFIIQRITKQAVSCSVEVDAAMPQMDVDALEQDDYAGPSGDSSQYPAQPTTQTPNVLTLQNLLDLYHLTDGAGTTAADSTPNGSPINGTITNGTWINSPIAGVKVLQLSGTGYVDCPGAGNSIGGTAAFAIGGWFSPSALIDQAEMVGKANNFLLELTGTAGAIRFGVHIGGNWIYLTSTAGVIPVNGRCFAMGVYDGANMYLYVSDPSGIAQLLTYSQAQTGNLDASTSDVYLGGSSFQGVVAECMIWGRATSGQEVQELFFQPLTQVVPAVNSGGVLDSLTQLTRAAVFRITAQGKTTIPFDYAWIDTKSEMYGTFFKAQEHGFYLAIAHAQLGQLLTNQEVSLTLARHWQDGTYEPFGYPTWGITQNFIADSDMNVHYNLDVNTVFELNAGDTLEASIYFSNTPDLDTLGANCWLIVKRIL